MCEEAKEVAVYLQQYEGAVPLEAYYNDPR